MSRRAATLTAWSLWVITVALTALSALLVVVSLSHPNTPVFQWWYGNTFVVIDATVGAIVASRRPENPVGWLLCVSGVVVGASTSFSKKPGTRKLRALDPSLTLTRTQFPAIVGNAGHRKPFVYAGFANLCNAQQPLTARS
jgi:hypothetical protein